MKFEEALALMREGEVVLDTDGIPWKLDGDEFMFLMPDDSLSPGWHRNACFVERHILREWSIQKEQKYQYLFRLKGMTDWILTSAKYFSVEDLRKSLPSFCIALGDFEEVDNEDWEFRRIEP